MDYKIKNLLTKKIRLIVEQVLSESSQELIDKKTYLKIQKALAVISDATYYALANSASNDPFISEKKILYAKFRAAIIELRTVLDKSVGN